MGFFRLFSIGTVYVQRSLQGPKSAVVNFGEDRSMYTAKVLPVPYTTNACVHFGPHNQPVKFKCIACMQANLVNCAINN